MNRDECIQLLPLWQLTSSFGQEKQSSNSNALTLLQLVISFFIFSDNIDRCQFALVWIIIVQAHSAK